MSKKIVYAHWATQNAPPHQAELVTLWRRTWMAMGFSPKLLLKPRKLPKSAVHYPVYVMNNSWRAGRALRLGDLTEYPRTASADEVLAGMELYQEDLSALV